MVRAQDGRIPGQVVKAVHDDGHNDVKHDKAAQENEGDKVEVRHVGTARLFGLHPSTGRRVDLVGQLVAGPAADAGHHDIGPGLAGGAAEEHHESLANVPEVVVPLDGRVRVQRDVAKHLHADNGVNKEEHDHQHHQTQI